MKNLFFGAVIFLFCNLAFSHDLNNQISPSKKYFAFVVFYDYNMRIDIYGDGNIVFADPTYYGRIHNFYLTWDDTIDVLWVYSSDAGLFYYYISDTDNGWIKRKYINGQENECPFSVPDSIIKEAGVFFRSGSPKRR
jgi:hypothetical protein